MDSYTFRIIIEPDEDNTFHGYVPALPGCHTWGQSLQEAKDNLDDAIRLYVSSLLSDGKAVPHETGLESFATVSRSDLVLSTP